MKKHIYPSWYLAFVLTASLVSFFASCEKKEYQTIEELDNENINNYIRENNLEVQRYKDTDLFYEILRAGSGDALSFDEIYPIVYTMKSLDGVYAATDTFSTNNRYYDFLGYYPFGSVAAGIPNSPVERQDDLKYVVRDILQNTTGEIRIIVPSRLTAWGRQGNRTLGIPPNASMDYRITVHDNIDDYEERIIQNAILNAGFEVEDFEKTDDDIYYRILDPGTGDVITSDSTVTVDYILRNPVGEEMETGTDARLSLAGGTIQAWTNILPLIKKGGKIRFLTPSKNAYGVSGGSGVPPFLSLDFEVEIKHTPDSDTEED